MSEEYPQLKGVSTEAGGDVLTAETLDRALRDWTDPERIRVAGEERIAREQALRDGVRAEYARRIGVESLTPEQEKELWDGLAEAWWRHMKRTTNIEEWLSE